MEQEKLIEYAQKVIAEKPELKEAVISLIELCNDEIAEGNSPQNERSLCYDSIRQLTEKE